MRHRTPAYWLMRIMLAAAFLLPVAVALLWWSAPQPMGPPLHDGAMDWVGLPVNAVGGGLLLVGLVWMHRILRGLHDEPPAWRYRDH